MEMLKAFITTSPQYAGLLESTLEAMNQENITPQDLLLTIQELATESLALEDFNNFIVRQAEADARGGHSNRLYKHPRPGSRTGSSSQSRKFGRSSGQRHIAN